jgi:hypothetical protein
MSAQKRANKSVEMAEERGMSDKSVEPYYERGLNSSTNCFGGYHFDCMMHGCSCACHVAKLPVQPQEEIPEEPVLSGNCEGGECWNNPETGYLEACPKHESQGMEAMRAKDGQATPTKLPTPEARDKSLEEMKAAVLAKFPLAESSRNRFSKAWMIELGPTNISDYCGTEDEAWEDAYAKLLAQPQEQDEPILCTLCGKDWNNHYSLGRHRVCYNQDPNEMAIITGNYWTPPALKAAGSEDQPICGVIGPKGEPSWDKVTAAVNSKPELPELVEATDEALLVSQARVSYEYGTSWDGLIDRLNDPSNNAGLATDILMDLSRTDAGLDQRERQLLEALHKNQILFAEAVYWQERAWTAEKDRDFAGEILGKICVYGTLVPGERPVDPPPHAAIDAMLTQISRAENAEKKLADTVEALEMIYDKYENGDPVTEGGEPDGSAMGNCVSLSYEEEESILNLIPDSAIPEADKTAPVVVTQEEKLRVDELLRKEGNGYWSDTAQQKWTPLFLELVKLREEVK